MSAHNGQVRRVYAALQRAGTHGATRVELAGMLGCDEKLIQCACDYLVKRGCAERMRKPRSRTTTQLWRVTGKPLAPRKPPPLRLGNQRIRIDERRASAPQAVTPNGVRITRGPSYSHNPRYQCAPGEQPFGAGFAAVGPGRDITTGRGWE